MQPDEPRNADGDGPSQIPTSLDIHIERQGEALRIDLSGLPIFFGLSVLARDLGEKIIQQHQLDRVDIDVEKKVRRSQTPELAGLRIENVKVVGEYEAFDRILADPDAFLEELTSVFGTLQMRVWRRHLFPERPDARPKALVFPCTRDPAERAYPFRIVLERVASSKRTGKYFLRAAFEGLEGRRLDLASLPHVVVDRSKARTFIAGSTRLARVFSDRVRWLTQQGKRTYTEEKHADSYVFARLAEAGLHAFETIEVSWTEAYGDLFRSIDPEELTAVFKKLFLLLEDHGFRRLLEAGERVRMDVREVSAYVDLSQLGRSLNVSLGRERKVASLDAYLGRMPALEDLVNRLAPDRPLGGKVRVLLIHHVTAEILAVIGALKALGAGEVRTLFVHYGEEVPSEFLESLLDLDPERFRAYALDKQVDPRSVEGSFRLSARFSPLDGLEDLDRRFAEERPGYMDAMVQAALRLFADLLVRSIQTGEPCLVVEDGGYLTPALTRRALRGDSLGDLLAEVGTRVPADLGETQDLPLRTVLDRWLIGTVEHTRNGLDRLTEVMEHEGGLVRPAFSIAVSDLKVEEEAREVADSILSAVESILHAEGKVLSRRRPAVVGSSGAIGKNLVRKLGARCQENGSGPVVEVDLRPPAGGDGTSGNRYATAFSRLADDVALGVDLVLGVTGRPAFGWEDLERLLLRGTRKTLYLASGSTKTVEFSDVSRGLDRLLAMPQPAMRGRGCRVRRWEMLDPQTRKPLGQRYRFTLGGEEQRDGRPLVREVCFLGSLMPVNFLYYGVPAEVMDPVLCQLLRCALGLVRRVTTGDPPANAIHAVDRDIDADGHPLERASRMAERVCAP